MERPGRLQVISAVAAVGMLAGAWALTAAGDDGGSSPAQEASTTSASTTSASSTLAGSTVAPTSTTIQVPLRTEWGGLTFRDVSTEAGVAAPHSRSAPAGEDFQTGGAAVADYDGDGDQDVLVTRLGLPSRLLRNDGRGRFSDVAGTAGLGRADSFAAAVWADVDGDGDLDIVLTGAGRRGPALFANDGAGRFADVTTRAGLGGLGAEGLAGTASYGAALDDWDHDGDLDLVVLHWNRQVLDRQLAELPPPPLTGDAARDEAALARYEPCVLAAERRAAADGTPADLAGSRSRLFENDGSGRFRDVTSASGVDVSQLIGFQPRFADADGDGWNDLFVTGDYCTSRLYRNAGGAAAPRFVDVTEQAGVGDDQNGMGSVLEDVDGDGNLDWFVTGIAYPTDDGTCPDAIPACRKAGNRLYLGDGTGRFSDATDRFGVRDASWGWGAAAADFNQDGRLDLVAVDGVRDTTGTSTSSPGAGAASTGTDGDPTRFWVGTDAPPWPEVGDDIGLRDRANGKAVVAFDADGDGDLDLLVANTEDPPILYRNDTPAGPSNHWLGLRLRQPGPNRYAIGARVRVDLGDGSPARLLAVRADGSFESGDPTDLHLGLGPVSRVRSVEVWWPAEPKPQRLGDVAADQMLEVTRP